MSENQGKTGNAGLKALIVIILLVVIGVALFLLFGANASGFETGSFSKITRQFVLRPEDFAIDYHIDPSGESPISNDELVLLMGTAAGKEFVTTTGRIDGWETTLLRTNENDIGAQKVKNSVSIFEAADGAEMALEPQYLWQYATPDEPPQDYVTDNCNVGSNCTMYTSEEFFTVSGLTVIRYDVTFTYRNAGVWVSISGLDIEIDEGDALDAANLMLEKLKNYEE